MKVAKSFCFLFFLSSTLLSFGLLKEDIPSSEDSIKLGLIPVDSSLLHQISGFVFYNNRPLPFAQILLKDADGKNKGGAISDSTGAFKIVGIDSIQGYFLSISYFAKKTIIISATDFNGHPVNGVTSNLVDDPYVTIIGCGIPNRPHIPKQNIWQKLNIKNGKRQ